VRLAPRRDRRSGCRRLRSRLTHLSRTAHTLVPHSPLHSCTLLTERRVALYMVCRSGRSVSHCTSCSSYVTSLAPLERSALARSTWTPSRSSRRRTGQRCPTRPLTPPVRDQRSKSRAFARADAAVLSRRVFVPPFEQRTQKCCSNCSAFVSRPPPPNAPPCPTFSNGSPNATPRCTPHARSAAATVTATRPRPSRAPPSSIVRTAPTQQARSRPHPIQHTHARRPSDRVL
jgi:hypothetical protein